MSIILPTAFGADCTGTTEWNQHFHPNPHSYWALRVHCNAKWTGQCPSCVPVPGLQFLPSSLTVFMYCIYSLCSLSVFIQSLSSFSEFVCCVIHYVGSPYLFTIFVRCVGSLCLFTVLFTASSLFHTLQ